MEKGLRDFIMKQYQAQLFKAGNDTTWVITESFISALSFFYSVKNATITDAVTGKTLLTK